MTTINPSPAESKQDLPFYPNRRGVYILTDEDDHVLYVGRSKQLCRRASHLTAMQHERTNLPGFSHIKAGLVRELQEKGQRVRISFIVTDDDKAIEKELIRKNDPPWNKH